MLYPNQFPEPQRSLGPRRKAVQPASIATAPELYAIAPQLPELLRKQLLTILDLVTGAGLSSAEIRRLRGTDVKPLSVDDLHTAVAISIRKRVLSAALFRLSAQCMVSESLTVLARQVTATFFRASETKCPTMQFAMSQKNWSNEVLGI